MTQIGNALTIRPCRREESHHVAGLAAAEGWDPGEQDLACYRQADPGGLLLGELDGEPVGCVSAVRHGSDFGFLGLFIVRADRRGKGYGSQLWNAAMQRLGGRCVGLEAVEEEVERYARSGFRQAFETVRYSWSVGEGSRLGDVTQQAVVGESDRPGLRIRPVSEIPWETLETYDRRCFPAWRGRFLSCWTAAPGGRALAAWDDGRLRGYGVMRRTRDGNRIAPLSADDGDIAAALCCGLIQGVPSGETAYLNAPETGPAARVLVPLFGMREEFRTVRMYRGGVPEVTMENVYGTASLELG